MSSLHDINLYNPSKQAALNVSTQFWSNAANSVSQPPNQFLEPAFNTSQPVGKGQLNINAPSYIPNYAKESSRNDLLEQELQTLKVEMILKDQIIKNLTDQLTIVDNTRSKHLQDLSYQSVNSMDSTLSIPQNHYQLFKDLSNTLQQKSQELESTKERLEALLVGLSMNPGNSYSNNTSFTKNGGFDEQELSHKILCKLNLLKSENENLLKMISFGNKSSLIVEVGILRNENKALKSKLSSCQGSLAP